MGYYLEKHKLLVVYWLMIKLQRASWRELF